jgi:hypothetical protein
MLKKVLIAFAIVIAALVVIVALQPADYLLARSTTIKAPAAQVFALVNDFHKWQQWSPWGALDPEMKVTYSGPDDGKGAIYHWTGNKQVGEGRMTITEARPIEFVQIQLDFIQPFASSSITEFTLKAEGEAVHVTWSMRGVNNFMEKAVCLIASMDKMVGPDFEKGLKQLKTLAERPAR